MSPTQKMVAETLERIVRQNDELIKILKELALPSRPQPEGMDFIEVKSEDFREATAEEMQQELSQPAFIISTRPTEVSPMDMPVIDDKPLLSPAGQAQVMTELAENKLIKKPRKKSDGRGIPVWEAYSQNYWFRYKVSPVRNAMTNRICSQLADRLGDDAAALVVSYYVQHNDFFYVKNAHAIQYCLKDAEKLHMEWSRGRRVTTADARLEERKGHNAQVIEQVMND